MTEQDTERVEENKFDFEKLHHLDDTEVEKVEGGWAKIDWLEILKSSLIIA